jgi:sigma-B regulation protein RsbU (phosphoserine phosphatase)
MKVGEAAPEEPMSELAIEINAARELQLKVLPSEPPRIPGYEVTAFYDACDLLAGDFFDFIEPDLGYTGFLVADVSGHGLTAAMIMSAAMKTFSIHARGQRSPRQVLINVHKELENDLPRERFITAFYAILNQSSGKVSFARAGHNSSLLCAGEGAAVEVLRTPGLAIGLGGLKTFSESLQEGETHIPPGGSLLMYSDGLTEAHNLAGDQYGEERLMDVYSSLAGLNSRPLVESLVQDVHTYTETDINEDDVTVLAVKRK